MTRAEREAQPLSLSRGEKSTVSRARFVDEVRSNNSRYVPHLTPAGALAIVATCKAFGGTHPRLST